MVEYQNNLERDPNANLILQVFTTNATIGVVLTVVYLKPEVSPPAFKPFYSIRTVIDTTKIQTITQLISGRMVPPVPRFDWFTTSFRPKASLYHAIESIVTTAPELQTLTSLTAGSLALALQPNSASVVHAGNSRGGNALGLQAIGQTWFALDTAHWFAKDDEAAHNATRALNARVERVTRNEGTYLPYQFMNDAIFDQDVI